MLRKLFLLLLVLSGAAAGLAAGAVLRPSEPQSTEGDKPENDAALTRKTDGDTKDADVTHEYVKLNNQFVVPVVKHGRVVSLVVLSLSIEVGPGQTERVYQLEPKLRDGLLQIMFDHANSGGFDGAFTEGANLVVLRKALREGAARIFGPALSDVLIVDIVRQDN